MSKIKSLISFTVGAAGGLLVSKYRTYEPRLEALEQEKGKYYRYYQLLNQWLVYRQQGRSAAEYLEKKGYRSAAIYGMGLLGERLFDDLRGSAVEVRYGIDQMSDGTPRNGLKMINLEGAFEEVDCIVISPFLDYSPIEELLYGKIQGDILALDEVIDGLGEVD